MTSAAETYAARYAEIETAIACLQGQLEIHRRRQTTRPGDWGFPGDLDRIVHALHEITPVHLDRRCEWKHPTSCGEFAAYCMPDGRCICPDHAPESGFDPSECLDLESGMPADAD